jgi:hypothetical protein
MRELRFKKDFLEPILSGIKTQTARPSTHIKAGDTVSAVASREKIKELKILSVEKRTLSSFTDADAEREGCVDLDDFKAVWKRIYSKFDPNQVVSVIRW